MPNAQLGERETLSCNNGFRDLKITVSMWISKSTALLYTKVRICNWLNKNTHLFKWAAVNQQGRGYLVAEYFHLYSWLEPGIYLAHFESHTYQTVNHCPLNFDITKFCCVQFTTIHDR